VHRGPAERQVQVTKFECRLERRINFGPERETVVGEILLVHARDGIVNPVTKRISEDLYHPIAAYLRTVTALPVSGSICLGRCRPAKLHSSDRHPSSGQPVLRTR
jgi:hypothetical protein